MITLLTLEFDLHSYSANMANQVARKLSTIRDRYGIALLNHTRIMKTLFLRAEKWSVRSGTGRVTRYGIDTD